MTTPQGMEVFEARLATFGGTSQSNKKRASNAKNAKSPKWPHTSPSPDQLAQAGFFYQPSPASPDNVTCYSCSKDLDGWDSEDNAIKEHLALSPDCGYALQLGIENELGVGDEEESGPMSEKMIEARKVTFGDMWPHERKRGWQCKSQKMAEAGWYYCPTPESEDFVKCAYCSLSLDGWEPKDKPYDEHHRRSPDCAFFTSQQNVKPKATRGKKGRASKASRMSIQTNTTVMTEDHTMTDAGLDGESVLTTAQETTAPTATKGKKTGKAKKGQSKAKVQKMQVEEPQLPSSFVEPEDDDFEVKVVEPPVKKGTRGKKRTSEQMEAENPPEDAVLPPPTKRRAGRTRSSTVKPESILGPSQLDNTVVDVTMIDAEEQPPPVPKKKGKGGRKRASSTTRKTSTASTASKASLRAEIPGDDEIEAALEVDLNRPLTDDEDAKMVEEQPAPVRRGRAASKSKKGKASAAPLRGGNQASTEHAIVEDSIVQVLSTQEPESMIVDEIPAIKNPKGRTRTAKGTANGPKPAEDIDGATEGHNEVHPSTSVEDTQENTIATKPATKAKGRQPKGRQASRKKAAQEPQVPSAPVVQLPEVPVEDLDLTITSKTEELGHDLDNSLASQSTVMRGGRKASATQKKGKVSKKAAAAIRVVQEVVQPPPQMEMEIDPESETIAAEASPEVLADEEATGRQTKCDSRSKGKKASVSQIEDEVVIEELDMVNEDVEMISETPLEEVEVVSETPQEEVQDQTVVVLEEQEFDLEPEFEPEPELPPLPVQPPTPQQQQRQIPSPTPSPQSSDAENHPPSSRPSQTRPPLAELSPMHPRTVLVPLATTPKQSPSKQNISKLETTFAWSRIDFEEFFAGTPRADREKVNLEWFGAELTEEEKNMGVGDWTWYIGKLQEERLKAECERVISRFESQGVRALKTLEGIVCVDS